MAVYHLSVEVVQRSAGRSATAAAAFRAAGAIRCEREGKTHNYTRKQGVTEAFIVAPEGAPAWAHDRGALWNAAEAREMRKDSVTTREWELGLPAELDAGERRRLARDFAQALADRYGVAADVTIHAPDRAGDGRNWHAHVLTTTRRLEPSELTAKTRVLDAPGTRRAELVAMRELWAAFPNVALERAVHEARVDHRSLATRREDALARGDARAADLLDRPPGIKLGPAASALERRARRAAKKEGREYAPITDRGEAVHVAGQIRAVLEELHELYEVAERSPEG